jgi:ribosomal protein S18 acetylase RimI-like enzyme
VTIELRPASSFGLGELAGVFTRAYEGYVVPFKVDETFLRFMVKTFDLDLDASRVALRDGDPVGLANLGVRESRGWIGGVGVVAAARREGIGRMLMDAVHEEARRLGLREVQLEVIEQNEAAYRLYLDLGYQVVREVEIGSIEQELEGGDAREVPWEEAHAQIHTLGRAREPWQREDATLAHYEDLRGLVAESGAAVFRNTPDGRALLLQLAGTEGAARELLTVLRSYGPVAVFNVPADDPTMRAFQSLGGRITMRQREMALTLP